MKCHSNSTEGASASKVYSWEIGAFFGNITSSPQQLVRQTIAKNGDMFYQPVIFPQYHFFCAGITCDCEKGHVMSHAFIHRPTLTPIYQCSVTLAAFCAKFCAKCIGGRLIVFADWAFVEGF